MIAVRWIADFFELRPIFSLRLLQMFWWVYATGQLYRMLWGLWITLMPKGASWQYIAFETFHVPFRIVIGLALWRLFIEVMRLFFCHPLGNSRRRRARLVRTCLPS